MSKVLTASTALPMLSIENIKVNNNIFIDCIVTTETGKKLATIQASHQFELYTDLEFPLC